MQNLHALQIGTAAFLIMGLVGCKTLQEVAEATEYKQPAGVTVLSEEEIRSEIVGNTLAGESSRKPGNFYVEHYLADGTIKGLWNDEPYQGEWAVSGSLWCYKYEGLNGCSMVSLNGNEVTWYNSKTGEPAPNKAELLPGNPKDL